MPVFDIAKWVWKNKLFKKKYFRAVYRAFAYWHLFFFESIIYITIINHRYNSQQDAWAVCAQIVDCLYKCTVFRAKNSDICPIRPIPNVHAHTIGIVFASSKPIRIGYCFDEVWIKRLRLNGARLNDWIYWWTIEFIQFNFSIAHRWRKDGCQRVYELGLDQLYNQIPVSMKSCVSKFIWVWNLLCSLAKLFFHKASLYGIQNTTI